MRERFWIGFPPTASMQAVGCVLHSFSAALAVKLSRLASCIDWCCYSCDRRGGAISRPVDDRGDGQVAAAFYIFSNHTVTCFVPLEEQHESVAIILAAIDGFTVIVGRESLRQCIVKFQFSKSPASLRLIAAETLAEMLENVGLAAPEVATWKVSVDDNTLSMQGPITQSTLSGLMSVITGITVRLCQRSTN